MYEHIILCNDINLYFEIKRVPPQYWRSILVQAQYLTVVISVFYLYYFFTYYHCTKPVLCQLWLKSLATGRYIIAVDKLD